MPTVTELETLVTRFEGDNRDLIRKLEESEKRLQRFANTATESTIKARETLRGLGSSMASLSGDIQNTTISALGLQGGLVGVSTTAVKLYADMQSLKVAFEVLTGSAEKADATLKGLVKFAAETPFELPEVVKASKSMLAFGEEAENLVPTMRKLGDVAAGLEIPLGELVYLYGTLKSQGRAMTVDIRQFAMRGIPIYLELAKVLKLVDKDATKTSALVRARMDKMIEEGKVGFDQVEQAFTNMSAAGGKFGGLMEKQSKELKGMYSNMKDDINTSLRDIGETIAKELRLKEAMRDVSEFAKMWNDTDAETKKTIVNVLALGSGIAVLTTTAIAAKVAWGAFTAVLATYTTTTAAATVATLALKGAALGLGAALGYSYMQSVGGLREHDKLLEKMSDETEDAKKKLTKGYQDQLEEIRKVSNADEKRLRINEKLVAAEEQQGELQVKFAEHYRTAKKLLDESAISTPIGGLSLKKKETEIAIALVEDYRHKIEATKEAIANLNAELQASQTGGSKGNGQVFAEMEREIKKNTAELGLNEDEKVLLKAKTEQLNKAQITELKILLSQQRIRKAEVEEIETEKHEREELKKQIEGMTTSLWAESAALSAIDDSYKLRRVEMEADRLGMTQKLDFRLQMLNLAADSVRAAKEEAKYREEAKRLLEELKTPQERFLEQQAELNKMLRLGVISFDQFNKLMEITANRFLNATNAARDYEAALKGVDAVLSNSAEAKARVNAYKELLKLQTTARKIFPVEAPMPRSQHIAPMPRGPWLTPKREFEGGIPAPWNDPLKEGERLKEQWKKRQEEMRESDRMRRFLNPFTRPDIEVDDPLERMKQKIEDELKRIEEERKRLNPKVNFQTEGEMAGKRQEEILTVLKQIATNTDPSSQPAPVMIEPANIG